MQLLTKKLSRKQKGETQRATATLLNAAIRAVTHPASTKAPVGGPGRALTGSLGSSLQLCHHPALLSMIFPHLRFHLRLCR